MKKKKLTQLPRASAFEQQPLMLDALLDSTLTLSGTHDLDKSLEQILNSVERVVDYEMAVVILIKGDTGHIVSFRSKFNHDIVDGSPFPAKNIDIIRIMR